MFICTLTHTTLRTSGTREESIAIFSTQIMRTAPRKKGVNRSSLSPSVVPPCFHEPYGSFSTTLNYALFTLFPSPFICLYTQFAIIPSQKGSLVMVVEGRGGTLVGPLTVEGPPRLARDHWQTHIHSHLASKSNI